MIIGDYLEHLLNENRPVFESSDPPRDTGKPAEKTVLILEQMDQLFRAEAPGDAPAFSLESAHRAAAVLVRLSQFLVFRELPADTIREEAPFCRSEIETADASTIWSTDLAFRFLPRLDQMARAADEKDPLVELIRGLAQDWPLSGVGIEIESPETRNLKPILDHPSLRRLFVDRLLQTRCEHFIQRPEVRPFLEEAVGDYGAEFAPWLADLFAETDS